MPNYLGGKHNEDKDWVSVVFAYILLFHSFIHLTNSHDFIFGPVNKTGKTLCSWSYSLEEEIIINQIITK